MIHRWAALIVVASLTVAACSGSGEADRTLPEVTLFTTTTPTTTTEVLPPTEAPPETPVPVETDAATTTSPSTTSVTSEPAPTITAPEPASLFPLGPDGLGPAVFGAEPDGIIGFMSSFLGPPTNDTGYVDPFEFFGVCSGTRARRVFWGSLMLEFGDASNVAADRLHFYAYEYGTEDPAGLAPGTPVGMATPEGVTYGSTVDEVAAAFPTATFLEGDAFIAPNFVVNDNFRGLLTGLARLDTVTVLTGGLPCQG